MIPTEQIPGWFFAVLASGALIILASLCGWVLKYVLSKNKEEWTAMRNSVTETSLSVKTVSESVNTLAGTIRLHEFRISENSEDIKEMQRQLPGRTVKYQE